MHRIHIGMRVQGGGLDVRMPKELLHHSQISAGREGQRGEGMPAAMDGQAADVGVQISQGVEELAIVPGEVPGMPKSSGASTEYKSAMMG